MSAVPKLWMEFKIIIMSKEYYKKKIIDLRASMQREKDAKKSDNE